MTSRPGQKPLPPAQPEKEALIVFAKDPVPGTVKTRLTEILSPEDAALLYRAFLADAGRQYSTLGCRVRYHVAAENHIAENKLRDALGVPPVAQLLAQIGATLGDRMLNAFIEAFRAGFERIVVIGTDHPTLPTAYIQRAFAELDAAGTVAIGPSEDGGYYLLGMNELYPELFEGMEYSHPDVFRQTMQRVEHTRASPVILPTWSDVDTPDALAGLRRELSHPGTVPTDAALATRHALDELAAKYGWA